MESINGEYIALILQNAHKQALREHEHVQTLVRRRKKQAYAEFRPARPCRPPGANSSGCLKMAILKSAHLAQGEERAGEKIGKFLVTRSDLFKSSNDGNNMI